MGQNQAICCNTEAKLSNGFNDEKRFARKDYLKVKDYPIAIPHFNYKFKKHMFKQDTDYFLSKKIGNGSYGCVFLGVKKKNQEEVAIKKIKLDHSDQELMKLIRNEHNVLSRCEHPNIVKLYDVYTDEQYTYIVQEYIAGCKPICYLFEREPKFNEIHRVQVVEKILHALVYLHANNIVHRDLKAENVVFSKQKFVKELNESMCSSSTHGNTNSSHSQEAINLSNISIKIIDFGFANFSKKGKRDLNECQFKNEFLGTPYYMAPEIINSEYYGQKVDIWSLGVLLYYLIEFDFPFRGGNKQELFANVRRYQINFSHQIWEKVSSHCKDFIKSCLTMDQKARPTAEELLEHRWIKMPRNGSLVKSPERRSKSPLKLRQGSQDNFNDLVNKEKLTRQTQKSETITFSSVHELVSDYFQSQNLSRSQLYELRQFCKGLDGDRDGRLNVKEIKTLLSQYLNPQLEKRYVKLLNYKQKTYFLHFSCAALRLEAKLFQL